MANENRGKLNKEQLYKVLKSAGLTAVGIILVVLSENLLKLEYGAYTPYVYATAPFLANIGKLLWNKE